MRTAPLALAVVLAAAAASAQGGGASAQHWAYRPIVRPQPPAAGAGWARAPLDRFVAAAMAPHGLSPSPAADASTWLRRVTLDLCGLPPTPAEVAAFVADGSADARERVVDRLLASPAFAERWAQWWLDLARYADSQGYEKDDLRRTMWRYRDWVIDAFARDLPFDRFTIEQLAGDLLPEATDEQRLATAFHRQTMTNTEGGTDDEEFRVAAVVDRVDTTMQVWMGSTLGCAQCHDHKYDPFSQREFFALFAFFDQTADHDQPDDEPRLRVPTAAQLAAQRAIELELTELRAQLQVDDGAVAAWAAGLREQQRAFAVAAPTSAPWQVLGPLAGDSFRAAHAHAFAPERDGVRLEAEQDGTRWRAEPGWTDGQVHQWSGDHSAVYLHRTVRAAGAATAVLSLGGDDAIRVWWSGVEVGNLEVHGAAAADQLVVPVALHEGDNTLLLKVTNGGGPSGFYFELRPPVVGDELRRLLALDPNACGDAERARLRDEYLARAPAFAAVRSRIAAAERELDAQRGPAVPVLRELPAGQRRTTRIHRRGSFLDQGDVVTPGTPAVWPPLPTDAPRDRLGFARWLMAADNPLTARVLANRLWSELFGQGLVGTLEDFGSQGDAPSHPELLDWLAAEFRGRWSIRSLLKTIVLSATYGQSSVQTGQHRELDPTNRWLARGPSVRLSAEMLRDQALAVSGLLVPKVGGPSVMPPQPDGIWLQLYSGERWIAAEDEDRHRRSLYTFWRRTSPHPAMMLFDAQSREACVLRRRPTNTPLQALVLWNDPQFREAAVLLGNRAFTEIKAGDEVGMIRWLWRQCLLRAPTPTEERALLALYTEERQREWQAASAKPGNAAEADYWAACVGLHAVAAVVLTLDELVTKR
ncbi:MAG: DUF1549 and DUF1553 domain-containing protein [Planctomycetes bacterium]|jgi:hypothetical protein|nr:DUF1549 and DUF1553 domain-containing protein [Planctomycetota bacterium]